MRILWDLRLYSLGYGKKGVGIYTNSLLSSYLKNNKNNTIIILGEKSVLPFWLVEYADALIEYKPTSWKKDFFLIPLLVLRHKIDVIHYWIALGPLHQLGLGGFAFAKSIANVHDLAVEQWNESSFAFSKKNTLYWKLQKKIIAKHHFIVAVSKDTQSQLQRVLSGPQVNSRVIYPAMNENGVIPNIQQSDTQCFVAFSGGEHKNFKRTRDAFLAFRKKFPLYRLFVFGGEKEEDDSCGVISAQYDEYEEILLTSTALCMFSTHEGLGLPIIEAMQRGIPVLASPLPSFRETAGDAPLYADPLSVSDMANAMEHLVSHRDVFSNASRNAYMEYKMRSEHSGEMLAQIYSEVFNNTGFKTGLVYPHVPQK